MSKLMGTDLFSDAVSEAPQFRSLQINGDCKLMGTDLFSDAVSEAPQFRSLYWRVRRKHGANTARVAVARAVLKTIYAMLKTEQVFEARPRRVAVAG